MKIEFLGAYGGSTKVNYLTSFFVDECLAIDAGCLTQTLSLERQTHISDILISHTHLDHTLSLPFLADNLFDQKELPLRIWARPEVLRALEAHMFNDIVWPDLSKLPSAENPTITFNRLEEEEVATIGHFRVKPVTVNHVVPTTGFFIESTRSNSCLLYTADTCTTDRVWEIANNYPNLGAVIVDCSFPNEMEDLAIASGHMTPKLMARDLAKLKKDCKVLVYHIKPVFTQQMHAEIAALGDKRIIVDIQSKTFTI